MTNRNMLIKKLETMDNESLAEYLEGGIGDEISMLICRQCQCDHNGDCLMDILGIESCPRRISEWLQEQAV